MKKRIINIAMAPMIIPNYGEPIRTHNLNNLLKRKFAVSTFSLSRRNPFIKVKSLNNYTEQYFFLPVFSLLASPFWFLNLPCNYLVSFATKFQVFPKNLREEILKSDYIQLESPYFFGWIKKYFGDKKIIIDQYDVEYDLEKDNLKDTNSYLRKIILTYIKNIEREALRHADIVLAVSESDKRRFVDLYKIEPNKIKIIPNGVDLSYFSKNSFGKLNQKTKKKFASKKVIVFVGSGHKPNKEAVEFIKKNVAPCFEKRKDFIFLIVGSVSNKKEEGNIYYTGKVKDVRPFLKISDIALNPMISGSGINIKMLELMSSKIPIITTKKGARGLHLKNNQEVIVCPLEEFCSKIELLVEDKKLRKELIKNSKEAVGKYSWKSIVENLIRVYESTEIGGNKE